MSVIGSTNHQWGMKKPPTDGSFTLLEIMSQLTVIFNPNKDPIERSNSSIYRIYFVGVKFNNIIRISKRTLLFTAN
ncbi:hypothetical protein FSZ17_22755 [Cytobacillus dafuensis]|uniref:Uncharacterized protein n=1 Tax=Cytobacillus dafuensis TaxID=1742359 RepID=A0A5B8ZAH5_CYTDA|nr:hypothetical protein FSZ17_22755 [Cytobacillus dafuensis]